MEGGGRDLILRNYPGICLKEHLPEKKQENPQSR
jgi:hypothetical protein